MVEVDKTVRKIVLQAEDGPRSFFGYVIVDLSLDAATVVDPPKELKWYPRYRWTDMALYRVVDPPAAAEYAVHVVGRSVLYHRINGPCHRVDSSARKGMVRTVLDLEDDPRYELLRACGKPGCYAAVPLWHHLETLPGGARVAVEVERPSVLKCSDAPQVVDRLRDEGGDLSELALKLLREAAQKDEGIAAAMTMERPL